MGPCLCGAPDCPSCYPSGQDRCEHCEQKLCHCECISCFDCECHILPKGEGDEDVVPMMDYVDGVIYCEGCAPEHAVPLEKNRNESQ